METPPSGPARIGHNQGPPLEAGDPFVRYCWRRAHKAAWRTPPLEIVRRRCRRAAELGLDYRSYTAILLDRGSHVRALFFDLGGTLVAVEGDEVRLDQQGRVTPLPGVIEKLSRLRDCLRFVVTNQAGVAAGRISAETARALVEQIDELCGKVLTDYRICMDPAGSDSPYRKPRPGMVLALLVRHRLAPSLAVMIGDGESDRLCAEAARLAAFIPADAYFARRRAGG